MKKDTAALGLTNCTQDRKVWEPLWDFLLFILFKYRSGYLAQERDYFTKLSNNVTVTNQRFILNCNINLVLPWLQATDSRNNTPLVASMKNGHVEVCCYYYYYYFYYLFIFSLWCQRAQFVQISITRFFVAVIPLILTKLSRTFFLCRGV